MRPKLKMQNPVIQPVLFEIHQDSETGEEIHVSATQEEIIGLIQEGRLAPTAVLVDNGNPVYLQDVEWCQPYFPAVIEEEAEPENDFSDMQLTELEEPAPGEEAVTCPHCWKRFKPEQVKYISTHPELLGDPIVGENAQIRFTPTKFNSQGYAIDAKGMVCFDIACPHCHLRIPEVITKIPVLTFSIVGAPACGKSYFLASMIWELRQQMSTLFDCALSDADPSFNAVLNNYESTLFMNSDDEYVALPKTELRGSTTSNQITINGMVQDLPLPFIFTLTPLPSNPLFQTEFSGMRNIVLYDNAGEHFQPGMDNISNPATKHLFLSHGLTFLYDPIKDARMVRKCDPSDPQTRQRGTNQIVLLSEMINRIRKYSGIPATEKYDKPLVVVIPKFDAWKSNFPFELDPDICFYFQKETMKNYLNLAPIKCISFCLREMIMQFSPEIVSICESFFSTVYYIPVSALGAIPEYIPEKQMIAVRPQNIKPLWVTIPFLIQLYHAGIIEGIISQVSNDAEEITDYIFNNGFIIYTLPGNNRRETIPTLYCGITVYSSKLKKFIHLPEMDQSADAASGSSANAVDDKDFWNN